MPVRLGIVGCGRLAELGYVPAVASVPSTVLGAVADPDADRRSHVASLAGGTAGSLPAFADVDDLVTSGLVDAVVVASPAAHHLAAAEAAVAAGLPVLVEKPPAPDAAGTARLARLAAEADGAVVRVGFCRRFDPGIAAARTAAPLSGPVELDLALRYRRASWSAHTVRDDVLHDLAPHLVDLARWIGGEILEVTARSAEDERATLELSLARGRARVTVAADAVHAERYRLADGRGRTVASHRVGGPVGAVLGRLRHGPHPLVAMLAGQVAAFAGAATGGPALALATAADGHAVMVAVDAARASAAAAGRPVPVAEILEALPC